MSFLDVSQYRIDETKLREIGKAGGGGSCTDSDKDSHIYQEIEEVTDKLNHWNVRLQPRDGLPRLCENVTFEPNGAHQFDPHKFDGRKLSPKYLDPLNMSREENNLSSAESEPMEVRLECESLDEEW